MINMSKFALIAAVALASVSPFALVYAATSYRHRHVHRPVYHYRSEAVDPPALNPVDDPAMTGGGSMGYNECAGHPRC
jgi:hypothetical protein